MAESLIARSVINHSPLPIVDPTVSSDQRHSNVFRNGDMRGIFSMQRTFFVFMSFAAISIRCFIPKSARTSVTRGFQISMKFNAADLQGKMYPPELLSTGMDLMAIGIGTLLLSSCIKAYHDAINLSMVTSELVLRSSFDDHWDRRSRLWQLFFRYMTAELASSCE